MIGQRLKEIREKRDYTQDYLAMKIGKSKRTISSYENDGSNPQLDDFVEICKVLNISADYLLGISDVPRKYNDNGPFDPDAFTKYILNFFETSIK